MICHNSRSPDYRTPFGAVEPGTTIVLSLDAPAGSRCLLRLWEKQAERLLPMQEKTALADSMSRFSACFAPDEAGLVWYCFRISEPDGEVRWYGAPPDGLGGEGREESSLPPSFQITVYEGRALPRWYLKSVVYQIFPDRFARGADFPERLHASFLPDRRGVPRLLHESWEDFPFYPRDGTGGVTRWDFFGGTLQGITERLDDLQALGVEVLYLNPIFAAASNHRYDTADYTSIDPMLGDEAAFSALCRAAEERGIRILLDGVFSHTGCDSIYFNKYGSYGRDGAWQNPKSPYRVWYRFDDSTDGYQSWWGVGDLPSLDKDCAALRGFLCRDKDSIVRRWLRAGGSGWRLDVADELPDDLIREIKAAILAEKEDALLLGEVWEDASNKVSYGRHRRYLLGGGLDCVMNYPFRSAALGLITGRISPGDAMRRLESLRENYPPQAFYGALNLIGSHDTVRVFTALMPESEEDPACKLFSDRHQNHTCGSSGERQQESSTGRIPCPSMCFGASDDPRRRAAAARLRLLVLLQMTWPGVPCIYYGDEAGLEGGTDPDNRRPFPWKSRDLRITALYQSLIALRKEHPVFIDGEFEPFAAGKTLFAFQRIRGEEKVLVLINPSLNACTPIFPAGIYNELLTGRQLRIPTAAPLEIQPCDALVLLCGR